MKSNFYINFERFNKYADQATDWFIKSWKFKPESDEYKICVLKRNIYMKQAIKHLKQANKYLND